MLEAHGMHVLGDVREMRAERDEAFEVERRMARARDHGWVA